MNEIIKLRDLLTEGAKAKGIDVTTKEYADFINSDTFAIPVNGDLGAAIQTFLWKAGQNNEALSNYFKEQFSGRIHGTLSEISENAALRAAKEYGFDTAPLEDLISRTKGGNHKERWKGIAEYFYLGGKALGEASAKNERGDDQLKTDIKRLEGLLKQRESDLEATRSEWEAKLSSADNRLVDYKTRVALEKRVRSSVKFRDEFPEKMVQATIDAGLSDLFEKYNVINKGGSITLYNKDNPTNVAINPDNGQELKISDVLTDLFPDELRQKQPSGGGNGNGGGNGRTPIITRDDTPGIKRTSRFQDFAEKVHGEFGQKK